MGKRGRQIPQRLPQLHVDQLLSQKLRVEEWLPDAREHSTDGEG